MSRISALTACGVFVSACSGMPSFNLSAVQPAPPTEAARIESAPPGADVRTARGATEAVRIESAPPGADARTARGATCRTPCTLDVPMSDGTITVALNGYMPQTVPLQLEQPTGFPNSIFVNLEPTSKPAPPDGEAQPSVAAPRGSPPPDSSPAHPKLASTASRQAPPAVNSPAAAAAGNFFVQIAAQKSEEDAQLAFRTIQAKYPDQLGGRQPVIRRKDLERGVFFGVQVGPFATHDEAVQLCESLKSAGGSCMIQKG